MSSGISAFYRVLWVFLGNCLRQTCCSFLLIVVRTIRSPIRRGVYAEDAARITFPVTKVLETVRRYLNARKIAEKPRLTAIRKPHFGVVFEVVFWALL
jgi:hypothetical protein